MSGGGGADVLAGEELGAVEARIGALGGQQLGVAALLDDAAVLDNNDPVGVANRR